MFRVVAAERLQRIGRIRPHLQFSRELRGEASGRQYEAQAQTRAELGFGSRLVDFDSAEVELHDSPAAGQSLAVHPQLLQIETRAS